MTFRLPTIESKNKLPEQQQYNFVNKDKEKRKTMKDIPSGVQLIDQLKKKIEQQKREIDTRNNTIMAIQRNFESMSVLLKNEKLENSGIREENQRMKRQVEETGTRAAELHEKNIGLNAEIRRLKEEIAHLGDQRKTSKKQLESNESLRKVISDLEANVLNLSSRLIESEGEKKNFQIELIKLKTIQKEKRQISERVIDLEDDLRKKDDRINAMKLEAQRHDDQIRILKETVANRDTQLDDLRRKDKDNKSKDNSRGEEVRLLKQHIAELQAHQLKTKELISNKDIVILMKSKTEEENKTVINDLKVKYEASRRENDSKQRQLKELYKALEKATKSIEDKDELFMKNNTEIEKYKAEIEKYKSVVDRLQKQVKTLTQKLSKAQSSNQFLNDKTVSTSQKMNSLIEQVALLKAQNNSLQSTVSKLTSELTLAQQSLSHLQSYSSFVSEIDKHNKQVSILSSTQHQKLLSDLSQFRKQEEKLKTMISEEKKRLERESEERRLAMQLLEQRSREEQELKAIIENEKQQLMKLSSQKELAEKEIEQERSNNRLLWSDNKKLKEKEALLATLEKEHDDMLKKRQLELQQAERKKQQQLQKTANELKSQYEAELNNLKMSITTNGELSSILLQKTNQIAALQQELSKVTSELEFYRNRNKELEGVVSRTEKRFKEIEHNYVQENQKLKKEGKHHSQMILSLTEKLSSLEKDKKQSDGLSDQVKKLNTQMSQLLQQRAAMKAKLDQINFAELQKQRKQATQKVAIVRKSLGDLDEAIIAMHNHLSCNHCGELPVQSTKLVPCGHTYCRKCKAGYEPNCGQCKSRGDPMLDKFNDQTISKLKFVQAILTAVKEDTKMLSKF